MLKEFPFSSSVMPSTAHLSLPLTYFDRFSKHRKSYIIEKQLIYFERKTFFRLIGIGLRKIYSSEITSRLAVMAIMG